jgi:octaprenyl-diphosphate synthase
MTLPLIYALQQSSGSDKRRIIRTVKNNNNDPKKIKEVIDFVRLSGGLEYAEKAMMEYQDKAFELLDTMPLGDSAEALRKLVQFTTERKK